jgi:endonuclease/exonuclease/phosphatase family metal-dependent hydrolase
MTNKKSDLIGPFRSYPSRAVVLVALTALAECATFRSHPSVSTLRVMSYNIQAGAGHLDSTAAAIRVLAPDIVALQEVDVHWSERSRFADQATELGRLLGMQARFAHIYMVASPPAAPREFGVALLSRFPIVKWRNDRLTRLSTQDSTAMPTPMPGLLEAAIEVNGQRVRFFTTHLDYRADPRVRADQVHEMVRYLGEFGGPTIVAGDLNAPPDAAELQPLFQALHDAWPPSAGPGLTYPAEHPVKRIDYVLVSRQFVVRSASVPATLASDHRPVVVDLLIAKPRESEPRSSPCWCSWPVVRRHGCAKAPPSCRASSRPSR